MTTQPRCVVTGAADGIGRALAHRFAQGGFAIAGVDVDAEKAAQTRAGLVAQGATADFIIANLADETDVQRVVTELAAGPPIRVLIHNAGINAVGRFDTLSLEAQQRVLQVNLLAPMLLTAGLLNRQKITAGGTLVFVSSLSHFVSYPGAAVYAATKDGLAAYARSLSVALAGQNIHLLTVFPGPTRTEHARRYSPDNRRENRRMLPEMLAGQIFRAVERRQRVLIPGAGNRLAALLGRWLPALTEAAMRKSILDKLPAAPPDDKNSPAS